MLAMLVLGALFMAGCAGLSSGISNSVGPAFKNCCGDRIYQDFLVTTQDLPVFLGPIVVSNFSVAMAERGLQPKTDDAGLNVLLSYIQQDLSGTLPNSVPRDNFDERIATGGETRFIARIQIEMRDARSGEMVWSGSLQRTHTVAPGDYMHTGRASVSLLENFRQVLTTAPGNLP